MDANLYNWLVWVVLGACLLLSFLLSGMEAGVFALNRLRVRRLARTGKPSAKLLQGFLENPERFLWTILVGNTLANFLILGWTLAKLHEWLPGQRAWVVGIFAAVVFLFYTFFDLLPKMLFRAHPNSWCLSAASLFRFVHFGSESAGVNRRGRFQDHFEMDGRQGVHRAAVRQPRGNARGDAGIVAGVHRATSGR